MSATTANFTLVIICRGGQNPPASWSQLDALSPFLREVVLVSGEAPHGWPAPQSVVVRFVLSPWGNRNRSRNVGLSNVSSDWVYLLDEDVEAPTKECFQNAIHELQSQKQLLGLAGPYRDFPGMSYWALVYNTLSNAWARRGRFLAGHVLLRMTGVVFDETLLHGGEEDRLLQTHADLRANLGWSEAFSAVHRRNMSFSEFLRKGFEHGQIRARRSTRVSQNSGAIGIALKRWPGAILFQSAVEIGALFRSMRPERNDAKNPHTRETSAQSQCRDDDHTP